MRPHRCDFNRYPTFRNVPYRNCPGPLALGSLCYVCISLQTLTHSSMLNVWARRLGLTPALLRA